MRFLKQSCQLRFIYFKTAFLFPRNETEGSLIKFFEGKTLGLPLRVFNLSKPLIFYFSSSPPPFQTLVFSRSQKPKTIPACQELLFPVSSSTILP